MGGVMASLEERVQGHYGRADLLQRIEALLKEAGVDPAKPRYTGLAATLAQAGAPPPQANEIVMGDDFQARVANAMAGGREGRLVDHFVLAEKP